VRSRMGPDTSKLTFNTAGSPTYSLHAHDPVATELAIGSAFVKPRDFDTKIAGPSCPRRAFIATPVIKAVGGKTRIPGLEALSGVMPILRRQLRTRLFSFTAGHWLAEPEIAARPGVQQHFWTLEQSGKIMNGLAIRGGSSRMTSCS